jgi:hypothetical protein
MSQKFAASTTSSVSESPSQDFSGFGASEASLGLFVGAASGSSLQGYMGYFHAHRYPRTHAFSLILAVLVMVMHAGECGSGDTGRSHAKGGAGDARRRSAPSWLKSERLFKAERVALFLRGSSTSDRVTKALKAIHELKKPNSCFLAKRGDQVGQGGVDAGLLEKFSQRYGASFVGFASHTKRKPDNLLLARMFNGKVLDSFDLGVLPSSADEPEAVKIHNMDHV